MLSRLLERIHVMSTAQKLRFLCIALLSAGVCMVIILGLAGVMPWSLSAGINAMLLGLILLLNGFSMRAPACAMHQYAPISFGASGTLIACSVACVAILMLY